MKSFGILHISDLHADESTADKLSLRMKPFLADVEQYRGEIDIVVVTGDISLSGKAEQFKLAQKLVFDPLLTRLHLQKNRLIMAPGNHDVDRGAIAEVEDVGIKKLLSERNDADKYYKDKFGFNRLNNYFAFNREYYSSSQDYDGGILDIHHIDVGLCVLNSSWLCAGNTDMTNLYLSEQQVAEKTSKIDGASIKIAILHHPPSWFSKYEQDYVIPELSRQVDVVITGHLHENVSRGEVTPQYKTVFLTAPSLYNNYSDKSLGYNIYTINAKEHKLLAVYKKFMKLRNDFDRDTEYAKNGEHEFELSCKAPNMFAPAILCQKLSLINTQLEVSLKKQLSLYQQLPDPILVTPRIATVGWRSGRKTLTPIKGDSTICTNHTFLFSPKDMGKSVFMKGAVAKKNQIYTNEKSGPIAVYLDLSFKEYNKSQFIELAQEAIAETGFDGASHTIHVYVDHVNPKYMNQLAVLHELSQECKGWIFVVAIENEFVMEAICRNDNFNDWDFIEIMPWGPSRIREFVVRFFEASEIKIDVEAAINFICHSLKNTDLPSTPVVIALYLSVFPFLENQMSSISFLHLLEKIEQQRIGSTGGAPQQAFYNKQLILAQYATICLHNGRIYITDDEAKNVIETFFKSKSLKVNADQIIKDFIDSGLLQKVDDGYQFSLFVFYDYYLAKACDKGILNVKEVYQDIHWYINLGQALALLSGMQRENSEIIKKIISDVEPHFKDVEDYDLSKLDEYIHHLLYSPNEDKNPEKIIEADLTKEKDYDQEDKEFDEQKARYEQERFDVQKLDINSDQLQKISVMILVLKTVYNSFRNLENLETEEKLVALNTILDLHISCNIQMIDFYKNLVKDDDFDSLIAYITTIGGLNFFSKNIGSQSLELLIKKYLELTNNDFKKLLLVLLYGDLRLPKYGQLLKDFACEVKSRAGIEILYHKIRGLIVSHTAISIPQSLIVAFRAAFERRDKSWEGTRKGNTKDRFTRALEEAKKDHLIAYSKDHIKILNEID